MIKRYVEYEGGKIFYTSRGEGECIVLIHGYLESSEVWGRFADKLAERYRIIAVDLPGNGLSSVYSQNHTMCFHAGAVLKAVNNEGIDKFSIIGHSLGGYVTLSLVDKHPDRLKAYVMLHSHPYADTEEIIETRLREIRVVKAGRKVVYEMNVPKMFADDNLEIFSEDIERLKEIAKGHTADGIIAVLKGMIKRKSRADMMFKSELPLLFVLGLKDNYIPYEHILAEILMPVSGEIVTLENSGHMGFLEETELLADKIENFLTNL